MCNVMGKSLALVWNSFHLVFGLKMQKIHFFNMFKVKMDLSVLLFFKKSVVYVVINWSTRLKNTKLMKVCLW